jgi:hypothetical protein
MECEYDYKPVKDNPKFTVSEVATDLIAFIKERYDREYQQAQSVPPQFRSLGIAVGGYSYDAFFADQYVYDFSTSTKPESVRPDSADGNPDFGANWWGLTDALTRLIRGFDGSAMQELINRGVSEDIIGRWINDGVGQLPLVFVGMPLQDAIDFAEYCVQVTIGRYRFGQGIAAVGGDVDIAVMRPKRFQWAKRKQWAIKD